MTKIGWGQAMKRSPQHTWPMQISFLRLSEWCQVALFFWRYPQFKLKLKLKSKLKLNFNVKLKLVWPVTNFTCHWDTCLVSCVACFGEEGKDTGIHVEVWSWMKLKLKFNLKLKLNLKWYVSHIIYHWDTCHISCLTYHGDNHIGNTVS